METGSSVGGSARRLGVTRSLFSSSIRSLGMGHNLFLLFVGRGHLHFFGASAANLLVSVLLPQLVLNISPQKNIIPLTHPLSLSASLFFQNGTCIAFATQPSSQFSLKAD